ncbi:unnamed protein product [Ceratitis capitata]|uniref:(Mediterranean fruit fly) hypothetical protein n=1 Tax=Ceratitis capitata TaxID=7213 RepID=A0A811UJW9_CERCA|nr:unnamed protein product [Ceratitis capitata]
MTSSACKWQKAKKPNCLHLNSHLSTNDSINCICLHEFHLTLEIKLAHPEMPFSGCRRGSASFRRQGMLGMLLASHKELRCKFICIHSQPLCFWLRITLLV